MFHHFAFMVATCLILAACSGADEQATSTTPAVPPHEAVAKTNSTNPAVDTTCPYAVAELNQALGLSLSVVNAVEVPFAGGKQLSCLYTGEQPATLTVNQLAMQDPTILESMEQYLAASLAPIPNDPDQAQWQISDSGFNDLTLHYLRAGTSIDVRLMGIEQADLASIKAKLVDLRRIP